VDVGAADAAGPCRHGRIQNCLLEGPLIVRVCVINVYIFKGFGTRSAGFCKNSGVKETF